MAGVLRPRPPPTTLPEGGEMGIDRDRKARKERKDPDDNPVVFISIWQIREFKRLEAEKTLKPTDALTFLIAKDQENPLKDNGIFALPRSLMRQFRANDTNSSSIKRFREAGIFEVVELGGLENRHALYKFVGKWEGRILPQKKKRKRKI